jgi:outer membrane lipoprotein-sorting protein
MENVPRKVGLPVLNMKRQIIIAAFLISATLPMLGQAPAVTSLSADQVMAKVSERDSQREALGGGYSGSREYVLYNHRMNKRAQMVATVVCDADGTKHFQIVSEDGWKAANKHVLRKMLDSESETSQPDTRPKTRMVSANYEFHLIGSETVQGRPAYLIDAVPRRSDKYLFRGRVWVDAEDFAVARVEGKPAKNPSFWTRSVQFVQQYRKSGAFWYPVETTSFTEAMIFDGTDVSIRYFDYSPLSNSARGSASPAPTEVKYVQH